MGKRIRTFKGKVIDIDEVRNRNEDAIAVGNMNVNARGDELDEWGNVVKQRDEVARRKNTAMSRKSTEASIISSFEDDEEDYELSDDPKINQARKPQPPRQPEKKSESKDKVDTSKKADETDLDD